MLTHQWNALRPGDKVLVHAGDADASLLPGVVTSIDALRFLHGVGVRVGDEIVWPSLRAVHPDPLPADSSCWRCDGAPAWV